MPPIPMITRVRLRNYRSIAECDVRLGPLTILVGPNGSGKSNFLRALQFLADALNNGLDSAVSAQGKMQSILPRWALDDPDARLTIELDLNLSEDRRASYRLDVGRTETGGFNIRHESSTVVGPDGTIPLAQFTSHGSSDTAEQVTVSNAAGGTVYSRLGDLFHGRSLVLAHNAGHPEHGAVYEALCGMSFYSLHVAAVRALQGPDPGDRLAPNGSNLASVLQRMVEKNKYGWSPLDVIRETLTVVTPGVEAIETSSVQGYPVFQVRQHVDEGRPSYAFSPSELSYGTLRTLGVLAAVYQRSMKGGSPVTLVGIEEPESALHPAIAVAILEAMDEASVTTQVLATTHSPAMLESEVLDLGMIRAVTMEHGRTLIGPIDSVSRDLVKRHLYTGGELLRMGHLHPAEPDEDETPTEPVASAR